MEVRLKADVRVDEKRLVKPNNPPQANYQQDEYEETSEVQYLISDKQLGAGGMGAVYEGWSVKVERAVAIKVIAYRNISDEVKQKFEREAKTLANLQNPALPQVYDFRIENGQLMMIMEKISSDHEELESVVGTQKRSEVLQMFKDLCDTVDYCAKKGIFHRDLKPSNMFVDEQGHLQIIDFGLSSWASPANPDGTRSSFGTPSYLSPEAAYDSLDKDVGLPSEVYVMGSILYEVLTGEKFFPTLDVDHPSKTAYQPMDIVLKVVTSSGLTPEQKITLRRAAHERGFDPEKMVEVIIKSHVQEPQARFQSGAEMLKAIAGTIIPEWDESTALPYVEPQQGAGDTMDPPSQERPLMGVGEDHEKSKRTWGNWVKGIFKW